MKQLTNQMCRERGLTVAEKGKHFDGSQIEKGEVIAWSKDKYNLFHQQVKDSFVADCAMAVLKALENCISKEKFIEKMKQFGWNVNWTEKRKHITFQNQDGKKVRDSNLSKTFHLDISKEGLENEFNGNREKFWIAYKCSRSEILQKVVKYIEVHIMEPIHLSDAAAETGVSSAYLSTMFKKEMGYNFIEYVNLRKIELARQMLQDGKMVYEVSELLGFENSTYFSRVFKRYTDVSPDTYRKQM